VLLGHLQVVPAGDIRAVANPLADDVDGKFVGEFRLTGCPEVVEEAWPSG
jgi:hypothetical protein